MSVTLSNAFWSLRRPCVIWNITDKKSRDEVIWKVNSCEKYLYSQNQKIGIYGDICITHFISSANGAAYPTRGISIVGLSAFGGPEELGKLCFECPCNVQKMVAGCRGGLLPWKSRNVQHKFSANVEQTFRNILQRLNLEEEYLRYFPKTEPLWFGLWIQSPLTPRQNQILRAIFSEMLKDLINSPDADNRIILELQQFIKATEISEIHGYPLHVGLTPPHHIGFGIDSTFAHCPLCKADADVLVSLRAEPLRCVVCGTVYVPETTESSQSIEDPDEDLKEMLGQNRFEEFVRDYLTANGYTTEQILEITKFEVEREHARQMRWKEAEEKRALSRRYREEVLFKGLVAEGQSDLSQEPRFRTAMFIEILRRCESLGIEVLEIWNDPPVRHMHINDNAHPLFEFEAFCSRDGNHLFGGRFKVPDLLLDEFKSSDKGEKGDRHEWH